MALPASVMVVDQPGSYRDALERAVRARGIDAHMMNEGTSALAQMRALQPDIVVVGHEPGSPGSTSLCRIFERHLSEATVYRIGDPASEQPPRSDAQYLSPDLDGEAVISTLLSQRESEGTTTQGSWESAVTEMQLVQVLLALADSWSTGRLLLTNDKEEREVAIVRGVPVFSRSSVMEERLSHIALRSGLLTDKALEAGVDHARSTGCRLGDALMSTGGLDGVALHRVMAAQMTTQLGAACAGGPWKLRFTPDASVVERCDLLRLHPMTAMLTAVRRASDQDINVAVQRLHHREVVVGRPSAAVDRWLEMIGVDDLDAMVESAGNLRGLAKALAAALSGRAAPIASEPAAAGEEDVLTIPPLDAVETDNDEDALTIPPQARMDDDAPTNPPPVGDDEDAPTNPPQVSANEDAVTIPPQAPVPASVAPNDGAGSSAILLALLSAGRVDFLRGRRMSSMPSPSDEPLRGLENMTQWKAPFPTRPLSPPQGEFEQAVDDYLSADRTVALDRSWAMEGPAVEADDKLAPFHALYFRVKSARNPLLVLGANPSSDPNGLRLAYFARLEQLDDLSTAHDWFSLECKQHEMRIKLAQACGAVGINAHSVAPPAPPDDHETAEPLTTSDPPVESLAPKAASARPVASGLGELKELVQRTDWAAILKNVAERDQEPKDLPAGEALAYAIALKEVMPQGSPGVSADQLAIKAMGELLGMPQDNGAALVLAKRALRQRPMQWDKPTSRKTSLMLLAIALTFGAGAGLLINPDLVQVPWLEALLGR